GTGPYYSLVSPGAGAYAFGGSTNGVMVTGPGQYNGNKSPLYSIGDTLNRTLGRHAFKFGGELRLTNSNGYNNIPQFPFPVASGGAGGNTSPLVNAITQLPNLLAGNRGNSANMSYFLSGSVNNVSMLYWITGQDDVPTQYGGT